ncbi:hypothetical protein BDZ91DRAFT_397401 [Kalaharituber pfeilii]|nr:hypothetical protein BDZ91DRAFT_397401 [Kalaharituber pfeilii]
MAATRVWGTGLALVVRPWHCQGTKRNVPECVSPLADHHLQPMLTVTVHTRKSTKPCLAFLGFQRILATKTLESVRNHI